MTCTSVDFKNSNYPCPSCKYNCDEGSNCICCDSCTNWYHIECAKISKRRFQYLVSHPNEKFKCKFCKINKCCHSCNTITKKRTYCVNCEHVSCYTCASLPLGKFKEILASESPFYCKNCLEEHPCHICKKIVKIAVYTATSVKSGCI